jgi:saccharopine dehydrogenase-like NADP-dependent oxidoreductase
MKDIVVLGAGKIGRMVIEFLSRCDDYRVRLGDASEAAVAVQRERRPKISAQVLDFEQAADLDRCLKGAFAVLSCAPYHCNPLIAERAKAAGVHYLDLTEDVGATGAVIELAKDSKTAMIPQCGLAPGFITIIGMHLLQPLQNVSDLRLRVGALPRYPSNMLKYNLTWSTEGLINEYCNLCESMLNGELRLVQPLENLETITIDGVEYEAFNTSGGLGTLAKTLQGRVQNVNYKSLRYPGHNHLIKFLLNDLKMRDHRAALGEIFDRSLPTTFNDQIVIFVSATGQYRGRLTERTYARTVYHQKIDDENWSGIQITTAAAICAVVDLLSEGKLPQAGFVRQEQVPYEQFIQSRFGRYYEGAQRGPVTSTSSQD